MVILNEYSKKYSKDQSPTEENEMSDSDIAIKVDGVSKAFKLPHEKQSSVKGMFVGLFQGKRTYTKQQVLKDISFEIKKGEFFGIVGRNGSGKSTLLKLLAGIYAPDKGNIQVNGSLTPFIELGVGFNPELTGRENVYLNGALLGFNRKQMDAMYHEIVEFAELEKFMDQKLKNYSSGMQVRLAFSIAIRANSDILVLDEVLAVGDAAFQQKCYTYFEEIKRANRTVVFVSHDMGAVRRFCTEAVYIKDGRLISKGTALEIADLYIAENIDTNERSSTKGPKLPTQYKLMARITKQTDSELFLKVDYTSKEKEEVYIGLAVIKDGISIAEIITGLDRPLNGKGTVSYTLDTTIFNGGVYRIDAALFRLENRELMAISHHKGQFIIKGSDDNKGAALKLRDTWEL